MPEKVMAGTWTITTQGQQGLNGYTTQSCVTCHPGQSFKSLTNKKFILNFHDDKTSSIPITGTPLGFTTVKAEINAAQKNGEVRFRTGTKSGQDYRYIDWKGTLSPDGTQITDGKFSFLFGTGTFTAVKDSKK